MYQTAAPVHKDRVVEKVDRYRIPVLVSRTLNLIHILYLFFLDFSIIDSKINKGIKL